MSACKRFLAVLLSGVLAGELAPTPLSFSRGHALLIPTFTEQALTAVGMSFHGRLLKSDEAARVYGMYRPAAEILRRQSHRDTRWRQTSKAAALDELHALSVLSFSFDRSRDVALSASDQELLAPFAHVVVASNAHLRSVLELLNAYCQTRTQFVNALRAHDVADAREALLALKAAGLAVETALKPLSERLSGEWESEQLLTNTAFEFLEKESQNSFAMLIAMPQWIHALERSPIDRQAMTLLAVAGITVERCSAEWPELREALRYRHFMRRETSEASRTAYLLTRAQLGAIAPETGVEWAAHPPRFDRPTDWSDLLGVAVSPRASDPGMNLETRLTNDVNEWASRRPWLRRAGVAALIALIIVVTVSIFPRASTTRRTTKRPAVSATYKSDPAFVRELNQKPGLDASPSHNNPTLAPEQVAKIKAEIETLVDATKRVASQVSREQKKMEILKDEAGKAQANVQRIEERAVARQETAAKQHREAAQKQFDSAVEKTHPGTRKSLPDAARNLARSDSGSGVGRKNPNAGRTSNEGRNSGDLISLPGTESAFSMNLTSPGARRVIVRFRNPVSGYIPLTTLEHFNSKTGEWEAVAPARAAMHSVQPVPGPAVNTAVMPVTGGLTPLPIPAQYVVMPNTISFSQTGITYDVLQDFHGQTWLYLPDVPARRPAGEVRFDLAAAATPMSLPSDPSREASAIMETTWPSDDTQNVISQIQISNFDTRLMLVRQHVASTMEYSLNPEFNGPQHKTPGHLLAGIDDFKPQIAGGRYRVGQCIEGNSYGIGILRSGQQPADLVVGYYATSATTEISNLAYHAWTVAYDTTRHEKRFIDLTPPDRDGAEAKYFGPELPAASQDLADVRQAQAAADSAQQRVLETGKRLSALQQEEASLNAQRLEAEQRLQSSLHNDDTARYSNHAETNAALTVELAKTALAWESKAPSLNDVRALVSDINFARPGIDPIVRLKYAAALCELALPYMSGADRLHLGEDYLALQAEIYKDGDSGKPIVVSERILKFMTEMKLADPQDPLSAVGIEKNEVPDKGDLLTLDISGSFPRLAPQTKTPSSTQVSVYSPPGLGWGNPQWVQDSQGRILAHVAENQIYDAKGQRILFPGTDFYSPTTTIQAGDKGAWVAVGEDNNAQVFVDPVTGTRLLTTNRGNDSGFQIGHSNYLYFARNDQPQGRSYVWSFNLNSPFIGLSQAMSGDQDFSVVRINGQTIAYTSRIPAFGHFSVYSPDDPSLAVPMWLRTLQRSDVIRVELHPLGVGICAVVWRGQDVSIHDFRTGRILDNNQFWGIAEVIETPTGGILLLASKKNQADGPMDLYKLGEEQPLRRNVTPQAFPYQRQFIGGERDSIFWTETATSGASPTKFDILFASANQFIHLGAFDGTQSPLYYVNGHLIFRAAREGRYHLFAVSQAELEKGNVQIKRISTPGTDVAPAVNVVNGNVMFAEEAKGVYQWQSWPNPIISNVKVTKVMDAKPNREPAVIEFSAEIGGVTRHFSWKNGQLSDLTAAPAAGAATVSTGWISATWQEFRRDSEDREYTSPTGEVYYLPRSRNEILRKRDNATVSARGVKEVSELTFAPDGSGYYIDRNDVADRLLKIGSEENLAESDDSLTSLHLSQLHVLRDGGLVYVQSDGVNQRLVTHQSNHGMSFAYPAQKGEIVPLVTPRSSTAVAWKQNAQGLRFPFSYPSFIRNYPLSTTLHTENEVPTGRHGVVVMRVAPIALQSGPVGTSVLYLPGRNGEYLLALDPDQAFDRDLVRIQEWLRQFPELSKTQAGQDVIEALWKRSDEILRIGAVIPLERLMPLYLLSDGGRRTETEKQLDGFKGLPGQHEAAQQALARTLATIFEAHRREYGSMMLNIHGARDVGWFARLLADQLEAFYLRDEQFGSGTAAHELMQLNAEVDRLITKYPWLAFNKEALGQTWMTNGDLAIQIAKEIPHHPSVWLEMAGILAALGSVLVGLKSRSIRRSFIRLLDRWVSEYGETVFLGKPSKNESFSIEKALELVQPQYREAIGLFMNRYASSDPAVQKAAWIILTTNHLTPFSDSWQEWLRKCALVLPILTEASALNAAAKQWQIVAEEYAGSTHDAEWVLGDKVSLAHFIGRLNELKVRLGDHLPSRSLVAQAA